MKKLLQRITRTIIGRNVEESPVAPIIGIRRLPKGPVYLFSEYQAYGEQKGVLLMGAADVCEIRVHDDPTVSGRHCLLRRHGGRVVAYDCASKNGIRVNGVAVDECELYDRALLEIGQTTFMAFTSASMPAGVTVAASTLSEFIERFVAIHGGNVSAAADALGCPRSTLRGLRVPGRLTSDPS